MRVQAGGPEGDDWEAGRRAGGGTHLQAPGRLRQVLQQEVHEDCQVLPVPCRISKRQIHTVPYHQCWGS